MQSVEKRAHPVGNKSRLLWLITALLLIIAACVTAWLLNRPTDPTPLPRADASTVLYDHPASAVASVTIHRGSEDAWTAVPVPHTSMTILGDEGLTLTWDESEAFLSAAAHIAVEEVLTEDASVYIGHLADYGLEQPRYEARIVYADDTDFVLSVGDKGPDGTWRYMIISGDDRLFAFSNGSVESLFVNRDTLRKVTQPDLHKARIDRITLTEGDRIVQWVLDGDITDADAIDRWRISQPFSYPADAAAMANVLANAANLRLSAYVAPATPENRTVYGFDTPRLTIDLHQAAGTIAFTGPDGATHAVDYPESTVTFVIGGEKSDMVDYILYGDNIYLSSHFTTGVFMDYDISTTMSRYPLMTALGNLRSLTILENGVSTEYALSRIEQVAANNELITDENGSPLYTVTVTRNGLPLDYAAFESAYSSLALVTVSGILPNSESLIHAPHTVYTFTDVDDTVHTVALATFDVLHDAVIVDGHAAFYLIKGGFRLNLN